VLHTLYPGKDALIFTSADAAIDYPPMPNVEVAVVPKALRKSQTEYRRFLQTTVTAARPTNFCVDTFPNGLFGELNELSGIESCARTLLARLLKWSRYYELAGRPKVPFDRIYICERMAPEDHQNLDALGGIISSLQLDDPASTVSDFDAPARYWLVEHSGPADELAALVELAREVHEKESSSSVLWINSQASVASKKGELHTSIAPSHTYYAGAERLFTGAGFNAVRHGRAGKGKHFVLPFRRKFDDQSRRACLYGLTKSA